jgi:two-component system response regulator AgrA
MRVNILEDDLMQQARMERCVRTLLKEFGLKKNVITVDSDPDMFIRSVETEGTGQLYLLDIEITGYSSKAGLEVAKRIREFDPYGSIIFVTTHENYAGITYKYKVSALGFIKKEESDDYIIDELRSYLTYIVKGSAIERDEELLSVGSYHNKVQFYPSEVLFFEAMLNREVEVVTKNSRAIVKDKLKDIAKLHEDFIFSHRSVVVNKQNIFRIDRENRLIHFENGEYCTIAARKVIEFKKII